MDSSLDRRTIVMSVGLTAALGIVIYGVVKFRQRKKKFAHLVWKQSIQGAMSSDIYEVPGTDYWISQSYFNLQETIDNFQVYEDDVWVVTYPKAGTSWTQEIVWLVCNEANTEAAKKSLLCDRYKFIDAPYTDNTRAAQSMPRPRFIKSHLPIGLLPKQFMQVKPKLVYTTRNPKDTLTSFYHFVKFFSFTDKSKFTFPILFRQQIDQAMHGGFWHHNLEAWRLRNEPFFLFLKYEDMIQDLSKEIRKVAKFMDKNLTEDQVQRIAEHCSFKSMKDNPTTNFSWLTDLGFTHTGERFMRKGKVGDWKNTLNEEQSEAVDSLTAKWLTPEGLVFEYE